MEKIKGHIHAEIMAEYAEVARSNPRPWEQFECRKYQTKWQFLGTHPLWDELTQYRRKLKTIRIGEYDVPEPLRVTPTKYTIYYTPSFHFSTYCYCENEWYGSIEDEYYFENGFVHLTREAAMTHTEAIISLLKGEK